MSTITREQLRERAREKVKSLEFAVTQTAFADSRAELEEELELARIALASLEAEPVAYSLIFRNMHGVLNDYVNANTTFSTIEKAQTYGRGGNYVRQNDGSLKWVSDPSLDPVVVPLYTAPPAPVSVPDEMTMQKALSAIDRLSWQECTRDAYMLGWNACRAAMLQGADGNSPVIADGWVACSERMPERDVDVQVYCADKNEQMVGYMERNEQDGYFRFASLPNGGGVYCQPTHWMPLPAAPQQEAKNV